MSFTKFLKDLQKIVKYNKIDKNEQEWIRMDSIELSLIVPFHIIKHIGKDILKTKNIRCIGYFSIGGNMSKKKTFDERLEEMMSKNPGIKDYDDFYSRTNGTR